MVQLEDPHLHVNEICEQCVDRHIATLSAGTYVIEKTIQIRKMHGYYCYLTIKRVLESKKGAVK